MIVNKRKWLKIVIIVVVVFNIVLYATGNFYLYKALCYNYVNIDDLGLFHTRTVKTGTAQPWPEGSDYNKKTLSENLTNTLKQYETVAFVIVKDDSLRTEAYWDGYNASSVSNSFSVAKSIVSILIGIAHDEGKIKSLDQPVCDYLEQFCVQGSSTLTIRHLLMMSSGLNWDESYTSLFGPTTEAYYGTDLKSQMSKLKVITPPGREFNYMSSNTQLLAFIIEKATGKTLSDYASEKLWKPIGAETDVKWSLDHKNGNEKAYCCFYATARDFARIGQLFLRKGNWKGRQIVSADYVNQCITPAPVSDNGKPNHIYGYQWWLTDFKGMNIFYARGILGQYIFVIPGLNLVFVRLGHKRGEKNADGELLDVPVYLEEVVKMYGNTN